MNSSAIAFVFTLAILLAPGAAYGNCRPATIGPPCGQGGLASVNSAEPALNLGAGNPIHIVTGNKYQQDVDLPASHWAPGLEIIRHYNSLDSRPSVLGRGWALSYDTRLFRANQSWQVIQADGGRLRFADSAAGGGYHSEYGRLQPQPSHYDWYWPSGTRLRFDADGRLVEIKHAGGASVTIQRHPAGPPFDGAIARIENHQEQALVFHYEVTETGARLKRIDTPLGGFDYSHDTPDHDAKSLRLLSVQRPDAMRRHYRYEAAHQAGRPYALTGIAISTADGRKQDLGGWHYDSQGRATRYVPPHSTQKQESPIAHGSAPKALTLDYSHQTRPGQPGKTVVTDDHGRVTTFHTDVKAGRYVLTRVEGSPCMGCAGPGTQAAYDAAGRLTTINGTHVLRNEAGAVTGVRPAASGWPGLALLYDEQGMRQAWRSAATGTEHILYRNGLPVQRRYASGDSMRISYDKQRRPVDITERRGDASATTRLAWHGHKLAEIAHPDETERRHYDGYGRVVRREIHRHGERALHHTDAFQYDAQHRLLRHSLPEGGSLHYEWDARHKLRAIHWHDAQGTRHTVIDTVHDLPGYRHGNGLHTLASADPRGRVRFLGVYDEDHLLWRQELAYDEHNRIIQETARHRAPAFSDAAPASASAWRYAYDAQSRLIGAQKAGSDEVQWFAWHADGSAAARKRGQHSYTPRLQRDSSGLLTHADGFELEYGPGRRLSRIRRNGRIVAHYQHNAFGYRIARESPHNGRSDYFYLDNKLVGQKDGNTALRLSRRYVYAHHVPIAFIDYSPDAPDGRLYAIHADLLGAPRLVTDAQRHVRWQADYSPLGQARTRGDITLSLRLPGQIHDPDTGWHDNLLRTYMPEWGQYLEPDPLGPVPGNQAYGYAAQQPRRFVDPLGLLLFAFDGTRQSADTLSNVWKLSRHYQDGAVHYHDGPGNAMFVDWDALTAHQVKQILDTQWKWLLLELSRAPPYETTPIDILGFSRGAALARHFGNRISQHVDNGLFQVSDPFIGTISACVDLRFMGLFDTVAQFGVAGVQNRNYDLTIASAWQWVAHAVALHEHRWLFPLTSATDGATANVVEAPFIGAHADIGGGILPAERDEPGGRGDLSDVALNWMLWQAQAAWLHFTPLADDDRRVANPIIHDYRSGLMRRVQDGDRSVLSAGHQPLHTYQQDHDTLGRSRREQTAAFIERFPDWERADSVEVGTVDMQAYAAWLREELGWNEPPV